MSKMEDSQKARAALVDKMAKQADDLLLDVFVEAIQNLHYDPHGYADYKVEQQLYLEARSVIREKLFRLRELEA